MAHEARKVHFSGVQLPENSNKLLHSVARRAGSMNTRKNSRLKGANTNQRTESGSRQFTKGMVQCRWRSSEQVAQKNK